MIIMLPILCCSLLLLFLAVSTSYAYDCSVGCYWESNTDIPVCGEDNNVYPNECIAICQNVTIIKTGLCHADMNTESSRISSSNTAVTSGVLIPIEKMKQYNGYKLIRKYNNNELQGQVYMPVVDEEMIDLMRSQEADIQSPTIQTITPLMLDSEGYEYIGMPTEIIEQVSNEPLRSVSGYNPHNHSSHVRSRRDSRHLYIFGSDDRKKIRDTTKFPFSTVGAVGYDPDVWICTGTVISRSAVLTAAHCVFNRTTQQWSNVSYFAPGRGDYGVGWYDPFGTWPVQRATILKQYANSSISERYNYDFAVITLQPNFLGQYIGDVVGYAGLDEVSGFNDKDLDLSTITGYPGDKGGGTMWTMGLCPGGFVSGAKYGFDNTFIALHKCDITGGTSGSALMRLKGVVNNDYRARGVNVFETATPVKFPWNGANFFKRGNGLYDTVYNWSGRALT